MAGERRGAAILLALLVGVAQAAAEQPPPDVKRVCVPAADGKTWECGTVDNPPTPHPLPPPEERPGGVSNAPPPFFLANPNGPAPAAVPTAPPPERPRNDDFPEVERVTPSAETADTSADTETAAADTATAEADAEADAATVDAVSDSGAATVDDLAATDTASADEVAATESSATDTPAEPMPAEATDAAVADAGPADAAPASEPATTDATTTALDPGRVPLTADAFLALNPLHQTVQLARAASPDQFAATAWALGLAPESTYAVPFDLNGTTVWLLLWSDFPDFAQARTAIDALTRSYGLGGAYVRRIGPLQRELRAHTR